VGIVNSSWGGTTIEAWISDEARGSTSVAAALDARWQEARRAWPPERVARYPADMAAWQQAQAQADATHTKNLLPWPQPPASLDSPALPGGLYNGMIAPLQPGALRGILWYQGASNVDRPDEYAELFPALIRSWRANWGESDLPFYFVQLPNYADGDAGGRKWARLREAQTKALALPATGMAVTIDAGEADNLHPTNKEPVGRRLALVAEAKTYGMAVDYSGPRFARATRDGRALRVHFTHAVTGLVAHNQPVQALELAGSDKVFHAATAKIEGETLLVSAPDVADPVAVRYAWTNAPVANLYNGSGLPAAPFRSDDW
jgi:sialate O-acetylesterase